ncbi:MAG: hypothetical protein ABJA50_12245 [Chloroflexota bacterium]
MLDISPPENKDESHMQAGRTALQQDVPAPETARSPDAMQSYAEAEEATSIQAVNEVCQLPSLSISFQPYFRAQTLPIV